MLEIRYDKDKIRRLERELAGFPRNSLPKVMSRGLNRTASSARTATSRMLAGEASLKISDVRKRITLIKASYRRWRAGIKISRRRIGLIRFRASRTKAGVRYKRDGGWVLARHSFIATMKSGHKGVFLRARYIPKIGWNLPMKSDQRKESIYELKGPSMGQVFVGAQDKANAIYRDSMRRLEENINDQVRLILRRRLPA